MLDYFTGDKVDVRMSETCGAYIMIEPFRIGAIKELLQENDIPFMLEEGNNTCLGAPEAAVIEFGWDADLGKIQSVLDSVR